VLSAAIANEPRNERHWFYLGQSYADAGLADEAIAAYERRVELGGWEEETYVALLRLARAKESAGRSFAEVVEAYVRAHERRPTRAEAVTDLARYARCQGAHALAHMAASAAIAISRPSADVLFVESDVYRWRALDEYSLACHHTGRDEEAVRAMNRLLESGSLTPDSHARVLTNHRFARGTSTRWRVVVLEPSGYLHVRGLDPVARLVDGALRELGLDSRIASRPEPMSRSIVFGAHVLPERASLPADAVLFNLEQIDVDSPWLTAGYRDLLRRHPVWDYHPRNVDRLRAFGVENVWEVPLGYGPSLAIAGDAIGEPRVDVLLFGSLNERRERVLADLSARGLVVEHAFGVYGEELDRRIARAKVVLNLRFYANGLFEIVRVLPLLARGVCVVTEDAPGDPVLEPLRDGLVVAPYDGLAEACAGLARASTAARDSLGARARHAARARSMVAAVRRAVVAMGVPIPPPDAARDAEADPR
jgi:hypothetical protein